MVEEVAREQGVADLDVAAALAAIVQGETPLLLPAESRPRTPPPPLREPRPPREREPRTSRERESRPPRARNSPPRGRAPHDTGRDEDLEMETFRVEVGRAHGVRPANIVGAIASEAGLAGKHIGRVDIRGEHSFVDLPAGMPGEILRELGKVRVVGQALRIRRVKGSGRRA
jgi:ATP-dependent RNA helicase DeaD